MKNRKMIILLISGLVVVLVAVIVVVLVVNNRPVIENTVDSGFEFPQSESRPPAPTDLPGMPKDYVLSAEQVAQKKDIADNLLPLMPLMTPGEDYVDGQFICQAVDREEAEMIAEAYASTLSSFDSGLAVIDIPAGSPYTLYELLAASAETDNNLPPISLNQIGQFFGEESGGEIGRMEGEEPVIPEEFFE